MARIAARSLAAPLLAALLAQPLAAQGPEAPWAAPAPSPRSGGEAGAGSERAMRNLVLGLAALAALGLALRAARDDEAEDEARSRRLPRECLAEWPLREGTARLYDYDCLAERFGRADELPLDCAVTVRSEGRFVSGFDPHCLREAGWRVD